MYVLVPFWTPTNFRSTWYQWAVRSIIEVQPHEMTGHQNWPASYVEHRANVVQMNMCVLDICHFRRLPATGAPSHADICTHTKWFRTWCDVWLATSVTLSELALCGEDVMFLTAMFLIRWRFWESGHVVIQLVARSRSSVYMWRKRARVL